MTVVAGTARYNLPQVGSHAAFPGLCRLPDGNLLRVWRDGPEHTGGSNGRIFGQRLSSDLEPLGGPYLLLDWAALDLRDPAVMVTADGVVWLTFFSYNSPTDPQCRSWAAPSYDEGASFETAHEIAPSATSMAITAPLVEGPGGMLIAFTYGQVNGTGQLADSTYCYRSLDDGLTWTGFMMSNGDAASRNFQEPWGIRFSNGALVVAQRWGSKDSICTVASWDNGVTWSLPSWKFSGWGRPTIIELSTGPLVIFYRDKVVYPNDTMYRVSLNRGGIWGAPVVLDHAGAQMAYAAAVETAPGLLAVVAAVEDTATNARCHGLHLLDVA